MADQPEVIQQELEQTRSALAEKLGVIGEKISGTVENVSETVESVTQAVENTVEAVTDTVESVGETATETVEAVKEAFNIPEQVRRHPWLWFGGSVLVGFLGGKFLMPSGGTRARGFVSSYDGNGYTYAGRAAGEFFGEGPYAHPVRQTNGHSAAAESFAETPSTPAAEQESSSTSWLGGMVERFGPEINKLKGLALGTMFGVVRDMMSQSLPQSLKGQVEEVINNITETAGGKPIEGHVFDESSSETEQMERSAR